MSDDPMRVCVLADPTIQTWEILALETMLDRTNTTISLVVVNDGPHGTGEPDSDSVESAMDNPQRLQLSDLLLFFRTLREEKFWTFVHVERKLAWILGGPSRRWELTRTKLVEDVDCLNDADYVHVNSIRTRPSWRALPDDAVERIREESDVAVRFGFGLLEGDVLDAPEYGVLSFHPGDIRKYRGLGPSLAYLNGDSELGVTLQRLNDSVDGGEIVAFDTVDISGAHSLDNVVGRGNECATELLARGIKNLQDPEFSPTVPDSLAEYRYVSERYQFGYAMRVLVNNIRGRAARRLGH